MRTMYKYIDRTSVPINNIDKISMVTFPATFHKATRDQSQYLEEQVITKEKAGNLL